MKKIAAIFVALFGFAPVVASAADDVMIVYDGSNSMWGQIDGVSKIEIARDVMADLVKTWPQSTNLGLLAYGHRREGDCADIEMMVAPGPVDRDSFLETVNSITPRGRTPLTAAVEQAAETLSYRDNPATVVLVSDGVETCQADPCALAAQLERQGVAFTAHVIGFDLSREEHEQLACIAENTGGIFVPAENAGELRDAMAQVQEAIESEPAIEPEPESEPELPQVTLAGPNQVTTGAAFDFSWTGTINASDFITIVPAGADEGKVDGHIRVRDGSEGRLTAPGTPGLYELRYVLDEGRRTLASATVEVVEAEVVITSPSTVRAGAAVDVTWSSTINASDFITIVPVGSDEGKVEGHIRARDNSEGRLTAPDTTGMYEIRYVLDAGRRTLASSPVEVVAADAPLDDGAGLSAPTSAAPGETVKVSWTIEADDADRRVALAKADAPDFTWISAHRVGAEKEMEITLPDTPGQYEVRFLDIGSRSVLGRAMIAVGK